MRRRLVLAFWCASIVGCGDGLAPVAPTSPGPLSTPLPPGLLGQLVPGGYVVFFRHAARDASAMSITDLAIADNAGVCAPGSELTPEGASDALALGVAFTRLGIRVDQVYCSPTCRTMQMASLAFGDRCETRRELTWPGMWTEEEQVALAPKLREILGTQPAAGTNLLLISHSSVLVEDRVGMTVDLGQGDAAVFRPLGNGAFEFMGTIPKNEWQGQRE